MEKAISPCVIQWVPSGSNPRTQEEVGVFFVFVFCFFEMGDEGGLVDAVLLLAPADSSWRQCSPSRAHSGKVLGFKAYKEI